MPIFDKKLSTKRPGTQLDKQLSQIRAFIQGQKINTTDAASYAIGTEALDDSRLTSLKKTVGDLRTGLESLISEDGFQIVNFNKDAVTSLAQEQIVLASQVEAAVAGGIVAGNPQYFLSQNQKVASATLPKGALGVVMNPAFGTEDMVDARIGTEAYDERDNRDAAVYSIAYNMNASRQDEFNETFFPTIVVTPDNVGFAVTARLLQVYDDFSRNLSGDLAEYNKRNIIRAIADYTILKNEMTRIVPVARAQNVDKFVDAADIPVSNFNLEGESIPSAPLKAGVEFDLLALSQTDALLAKGTMDTTDSIDPGSLRLLAIYLKIGTDVLKISTDNLPLSFFNQSVQDNYRQSVLDFQSDSVVLTSATTRADGSALDTLAGIKTGNYSVRLKVAANGKVNTERGDTRIYGPAPSVYTISDSNGNLLDLTTGPGKALADAINGGAMIGYDLYAYRTNANRRQRGQLIDTTYYTQVYNVPLRSPITAIHPVTTDGQTDSSDLNSLITATRIRTSNQGVSALINAEQTLGQYADVPDATGLWPDVLGVGRFYVQPTFFSETVDLSKVVDSLTSNERANDLREALVNKIRSYAYKMYTNSQYKAAAEALAGGVARVPQVIIGTDPILAEWLTVTGDLRTLGGEFECRVVSTLDKRIRGKIYLAFGVFDETRNTVPNPLNFGNMAWSPEVTVVLPISRNNQVSKETAVQPRFLHIVNCPILTVLTVTNLDLVLSKVTVNVSQ